MKICVWRTGHEIADTVAEALAEGFDARVYNANEIDNIQRIHRAGDACGCVICKADVHIGYGILRGQDKLFRCCEEIKKPWFHVDRGYFQPSHFSGNYRISYRGTQARWHEGIPRKKWDGELGTPRSGTEGRVMIIPPTQPVCDFFGIKLFPDWQMWAIQQANKWPGGQMWRYKDSKTPLEEDLAACSAVITFNSSVGWKALQMGVPVLSDVNHSIVGSFYGETDLQKLLEKSLSTPDTRRELFEGMVAHDFILEQIRRGEAWPLIQHYLSGLASTPESQPPPMSADTPSESVLKASFQSAT